MTRLYIDKQEVATIPSHLTSLEEVVKYVEADHLSKDTVIRAIRIDGCPLACAEEEFSIPDRIDNRNTIEIFTSSVGDVALSSIGEVMAYLDRVQKLTSLLASSFRSRCCPQYVESLKQFYEGFYWINLLFDRLEKSFEIRMQDIRVHGISAYEHYRHLAALLRKAIEAHEQRDFDRLADLLENDILSMIPIYKELFSAVQEQVLERA